MQIFKEGKAEIRVAKGVFYNPKMSKLRDISVLFLKALELKKAKLLDSTAASGVRGIRYYRESGIKDVTMIDMNPDAIRNAKANAKLNKFKSKVIGESLQEFAGRFADGFDVIDIDPFGSPAPLIHDALKISRDGTILMVTATDTATLCGAEGFACLRIYGSKPIHNELCHEAGVRILLYFIAREAAQFNLGTEPMLSLADMHYMRVFVRLARGSKESVNSINNVGFGAYCTHCHNFSYQKVITKSLSTKCDYCGNRMEIFGPLWLGDLHSKGHLAKMISNGSGYAQESIKLMNKIYEEVDVPFFYSIPKITSYLGLSSVPLDSVLKFIKKRQAASRTHFEKDAIKTRAAVREVIAAVKLSNKNTR